MPDDVCIQNKTGQPTAGIAQETSTDGRIGLPASLPLKGWYRRGLQHPPHFDGGSIPQFVTFRLAGTLPVGRLTAWRSDLRAGTITSNDLHVRVEEYLDAGHGRCWLQHEPVAQSVRNALLHFDADRYRLHAWVLMPNHVHAMFTALGSHRLPDIVHSWKSFTGKQANRLLGRQGAFWQDDYFDRYIRDEQHFLEQLEYIANNPVRAGLCNLPENWKYSFCWGQR